METLPTLALPAPGRSRSRLSRAAANVLYRHGTLYLLLLLTPPLLWFGVVYLGSLLSLLVQSFYTFDDFTMGVTSDFTWANYRALLDASNHDIVLRTLGMAAAVTVGSAVLGFPVAYYMARYATGWRKGFFYIAGPATSSRPTRGRSSCPGAASSTGWWSGST